MSHCLLFPLIPWRTKCIRDTYQATVRVNYYLHLTSQQHVCFYCCSASAGAENCCGLPFQFKAVLKEALRMNYICGSIWEPYNDVLFLQCKSMYLHVVLQNSERSIEICWVKLNRSTESQSKSIDFDTLKANFYYGTWRNKSHNAWGVVKTSFTTELDF